MRCEMLRDSEWSINWEDCIADGGIPCVSRNSVGRKNRLEGILSLQSFRGTLIEQSCID